MKIKIVTKRPDQPAEVEYIKHKNFMDTLEGIVGGNFNWVDMGLCGYRVDLVYRKDHSKLNLPLNLKVFGDMVYGTIVYTSFFCSTNGLGIRSLSKIEVDWLMRILNN